MMKQLIDVAGVNQANKKNTLSISAIAWKMLAAGLFYSLLLMSCSRQHEPAAQEPAVDVENIHSVLLPNSSLSSETIRELKETRSATARYRNIQNAVADGYSDIGVIVPNMGFHYMKSTLVDATFDHTKPEILVYNNKMNGKPELVAVEFAVPINLSPNAAPQGFTGSNDVWKYDTGFGLWLLHAWVWEFNPAGVFNPTNPSVHVH